MIFPRSSIGKFGFSFARPRFLKRGQDESHGTFQKSYLNHPFFLSSSAISLLLEVAGNANPHVLKQIGHVSIVPWDVALSQHFDFT